MAGVTAYYDTMTNQFIDMATCLPVAPQDVIVTVPAPDKCVPTGASLPPMTTSNMAVWGLIGAFALIMYFSNKRR